MTMEEMYRTVKRLRASRQWWDAMKLARVQWAIMKQWGPYDTTGWPQ